MRIFISVLPIYALRETIREIDATLQQAADQIDDMAHSSESTAAMQTACHRSVEGIGQAEDLLSKASEIIDTLVDQIEDHCTGRPELRA